MSIPGNVIGCGPIVLPVKPVKTSDPEMYAWLQRGPTILVNLGTLYALSSHDACRIAQSLRHILMDESRNRLQIVWKLQRHPDDQEDVFEEAERILNDLMDENRIRVVSWLDAEPLALLETGHFVCSVHHGGANTWFEAIKSVSYTCH